MSRKLTRLVFVASLVTGLGAVPFTVAGAAGGQTRSVDAFNMPRGFEVPGAKDPKVLDIYINDTAAWNVIEGEHTVTPRDKTKWGSDNDVNNDGLTPTSERHEVTFKTPGRYIYYCEIHGSLDANKEPQGMWGVINVTDPNATTTTTTPTAPPTTAPPTTQPPATTPTTARPTPQTTAPPATGTGAGAGAHAPAGPVTTTTAKADKNKKPPKQDETTTSTIPPLTPPPPTPDIPAEAIIPSLPGYGSPSRTEVQEGAVGEAPGETPEGEAIALLRPEKRSGNGMKLLIASGVGLGVLGFGAAGYRFSNRSSKYFPA